jgi:hypothetical protein
MWLLYTLVGNLLMAFVNYSDEHLTHSSTTKLSHNIHERIGGVLIASVMLTTIGLTVTFIFADTVWINEAAIILALISSVPMLITWMGYFYLFQKYSAHQVVALFGLSAFWLLIIELGMGSSISFTALCGVLILVASSYFLDIGKIRFKLPSLLVVSMVFISLCWALTAILWREAMAIEHNSFAVYFWHLVGIIAFLPIFFLVEPYREGFIKRLKLEKKNFIGYSAFNEACSQLSFYCLVLAYAMAPLATFVSALAGLQSLFLLFLFYIRPIDTRNQITFVQLGSIIGIAVGIALLEIY